MIRKLTHRQKSYALIGGFFVFLWLGYQLSFSDTFLLAESITEKENKLSWLKEKESELPALKIKMAEFEKAYSQKDSGSIRDRLTAFISDFAENNNCLVTEIPESSSYNNMQLKVQTNKFTIKGGFHNLLTLQHSLEKQFKYAAKIMSSHFHSVKDLQTRKKQLYLTIVTQSFEKQTP